MLWSPQTSTILLLLAATQLVGCGAYPSADAVAQCAASRFGVEKGTFTTGKRGSQDTITYQKTSSPDHATVAYDRSHGPVDTYWDISFGNHAEIEGAVEAIRYCAVHGMKG